MRSLWFAAIGLALLVAASCSEKPRQYALHGQILAVGTERDQLTVKHDDIVGFMPAMTMAYRVHDPTVLNGLVPGDVVDATLMVRDTEAWIAQIHKTGHADLPASSAPIPHVMDLLAPGDRVPDDELVDAQGGPTRLTGWPGRALAVTFIYTRCPLPDFCPRMDRNFAAVQKIVAADPALSSSVHLVSITFDPGHDTPDVLRAHAQKLGADPTTWTFATGSQATIDKVASRFGVSLIRDPASATTITHNLRTAVVDPSGRLVKIYSGNDWSPDALVQDLRAASARR